MILLRDFYIAVYVICIIFDIVKYENVKELKELKEDHLFRENQKRESKILLHVMNSQSIKLKKNKAKLERTD